MKYYCLGVKGSGMATLANILYDLGNEVIGYDDGREWKFTEEGLDARQIPIYYNSEHELDRDMIVTYSKALREDHPELVRVRALGLQIKAYNEILGDLTRQFETISVAGTHGKTTTCSLISHVLNEVYGCNYFIGDGNGYADDKNNYFVIESDEFNRHFLAYNPAYSIITNIELEHTECYKDIEDTISTFEQFSNNTKKGLIVCGDNENVRKMKFDKEVIYYGFNDNNDVTVENLKLTENGSSFDCIINGQLFGHFDLPLYGEHMVLNALACITICDKLGVTKDQIHDLLINFKNAKRRFAEETFGDIVVIDDYAHHPTEVKVTLEAARQKYPDKELVALFKPNTYSRTKDFYKEFAEAMNIADKAYLTEIDSNRESENDYPGVSSKLILDNLKNGSMINEDKVNLLLEHHNAVICFMSCASIAHLKEKFEENLKGKGLCN